MRVNSKFKEHFELSLDTRQVAAIVAASLIIVAGAFVLGMSYGTRAVLSAAPAASKDSLATLDEPISAAPKEDDALRAHEALTAARPEALPAPGVKAVAAVLSARPERSETKAKGEDEGGPSAAPADPPLHTRDRSAGRDERGQASTAIVPTSGAPAGQPSRPRDLATGRDERVQSSTPTSPDPSALAAAPAPIDTPSHSALPSRTGNPDRRSKHERPTASHRGAYTIQVASVSQRADAERVAKRFARRSSRIVAADVPGKGRVWRVQVGSYATRDAASRGLAAIGGTGFVTAAR